MDFQALIDDGDAFDIKKAQVSDLIFAISPDG
jgi:hypothetical protein